VETAETSIPFKEAYFSRKYRFSQWNAIIFTIMQQVTGITFILFFVTFILQEFKKQGSLDLDVTRGAIIVNLFNLFCASASSIPMAYFGQRRILILSEFLMAVANFTIMFCYIKGMPYGTIFGILLFCLSY
jgi:hypothetical protein